MGKRPQTRPINKRIRGQRQGHHLDLDAIPGSLSRRGYIWYRLANCYHARDSRSCDSIGGVPAALSHQWRRGPRKFPRNYAAIRGI